MKVFVVPGLWVANIRGIFLEAGYDLARSIREADVVVWTGGADISPSIYGEKEAMGAGVYIDPERDALEIAAYKSLPTVGGPLKVGICRGAQLLCALSGGSLWQDIEGHGRTHDLKDCVSGELITVSSMHHQEMIPPSGAKIWATAAESNRKIRMDRGNLVKTTLQDNKFEDVEAVWIPTTESFCFQPHPEIGPDSCTRYFFKLIDKALLSKARPPKPLDDFDKMYPKVGDIEISGLTDKMEKRV